MGGINVLSEGRVPAACLAGLRFRALSTIGLQLVLGIPLCLGMPLQQHAAITPGAPETSPQALKQEMEKKGKTLVIDVRNPQEYAAGHVPGAINIPLAQLRNKMEEMKVPKSTTLVTVCEHGGRSSRAALELQKLGYKTSSFCRLEAWKKEGYKVETGHEKQ